MNQKAISVKKFLKNSMKLLRSPFPVMLLTLFSRRAFTGHLGTQKALEHSKGTLGALHGHCRRTWGIKALRHSGTGKALGHLDPRALRHSDTRKGNWVLWHLRHLGTYVVKHLSTQALEGHLSTQTLTHSRHSRHFS